MYCRPRPFLSQQELLQPPLFQRTTHFAVTGRFKCVAWWVACTLVHSKVFKSRRYCKQNIKTPGLDIKEAGILCFIKWATHITDVLFKKGFELRQDYILLEHECSWSTKPNNWHLKTIWVILVLILSAGGWNEPRYLVQIFDITLQYYF